ncbi:MAG TPA: YpdA family putative bacillithiol disulfide reductase [Thermoanaerobaculia bacterium]|nr:YpdA family putative bacillithiol disulfide reductase [Thermoanaerobaculia bacterium]
MADDPLPVAVVGAGPTGIACAVELGRRGIEAVCFDRGAILDSIYHFPEEMVWFSTRDLLDIAGVPFGTPHAHPTRLETLAYYRGVAEKFAVRVEPESEVLSAALQPDGTFLLALGGRQPRAVRASAVVLATGFFHNPKRLAVPGCDLPIVHERYVSGYPFHGRKVVVVGGKNSAAEAALDLYRHGASVTMVVRSGAISERVKYWIKPDLENRIRAGAIRALFHSRVAEIQPEAVLVETPSGQVLVPAEAVFPLIGYEPDFALLARCGASLRGERREPEHDSATLESNVPGLYLAGAVLSGTDTGRIFIENSRHHAAAIAAAIAQRRAVHV